MKWIVEPTADYSAEISAAARVRQDSLTKPPGSLGRLEQLAVWLASRQASEQPAVERVWISVCAADHGVMEEQVSAFPQVVTGEMLKNFAAGGAAISVLARSLGAELEVINLGVVNDPGEIPGIRPEQLAPQTANMVEQPAMTETQLAAALASGRRASERAWEQEMQLFIAGDMGIGNTTSAAALACAYLGLPPAQLVGPGTGLDSDGVAHKADVVARALKAHPAGHSSAIEILRHFGGFEIAAMSGAILHCAQRGLPVLVDGYIASVAALAAVKINPGARAWLLFSHRSAEPGHSAVLDALEAEPLLDLGMRLGEASGGAVALPPLRLACELHNNMATFAEAGVSEG